MSAGQTLLLIFILYWVIVFFWMKGTDPLAHEVYHIIWFVMKIPLYLCGGFIVFALCCRK